MLLKCPLPRLDLLLCLSPECPHASAMFYLMLSQLLLQQTALIGLGREVRKDKVIPE
jgi:hypothetical protein